MRAHGIKLRGYKMAALKCKSCSLSFSSVNPVPFAGGLDDGKCLSYILQRYFMHI